MESGRGGSHRPFDLGIDGLVGGLVALLGLTVEIWRDGQLAHGVDNLRKTHIPTPREVDTVRGAVEFSASGVDDNSLPIDLDLTS